MALTKKQYIHFLSPSKEKEVVAASVLKVNNLDYIQLTHTHMTSLLTFHQISEDQLTNILTSDIKNSIHLLLHTLVFSALIFKELLQF